MEAREVYDRLSGLFAYPREGYRERVIECVEALRPIQAEAAERLEQFAKETEGMTVEALQELYTQTFDLNPACILELGWHLFGEQYERGEFLVKMRQQIRRFGLAESTELPDHLTHALALLARMEREEADEFAAACVYPALDKMRAAWKDKDNPFEKVLEATARWLESQHPRPPAEEMPVVPALRVLDERYW